MLKITIPPIEQYDEVKNEFITLKAVDLQLEHSLVSLSKWESKWCKPFLTEVEKSTEETQDYISCMTITQNVDPAVYLYLDSNVMSIINEYIGAPMTATIVTASQRKSREIITAELIYYWMIALNIPFECQKWHLNRLLTLINVCSIKNSPPKKMSRREIMARNIDLNNARRAALGTKG